MAYVDDLELVDPPSRAKWREWLEKHHATSKGVALAVAKKNGSRPGVSYDEAVEEALCFGWIDSTVRRLDDDRFRQLFTPRKPTSTWSQSNKDRVARLITEGRMAPAGLAAVEVAKANGSWDLLTDVEAGVVPDDLTEALAAAPGATEGFEALPTSQRQMALYWIATARRAETRARRIAEVVSAAAEGRPPG